MHTYVDRRRWLALAATALVYPRSLWAARSAVQAEPQRPSRFAVGTAVTSTATTTGRIAVGPDDVEVLGERGTSMIPLRKLRELELAARSVPDRDGGDGSAASVAADAERKLDELAAQLAGNPTDASALESWLAALRRSYTGPQPLGPPLQGDVWAVPDATRHHADHAASAFALDLAVLGERDRVHRGKGERNEDYASWDAPLLAVADGRVARARDDLADDEPFRGVADPARANDLVLELEQGLAFYQHLRRGSLIVKPGDRVRRGDELARTGNSGNASWPHLHFAVYERFATGPVSVPIQVERYALLGTKSSVDGKPKTLSVACRNVPLQEGWVVRLERG